MSIARIGNKYLADNEPEAHQNGSERVQVIIRVVNITKNYQSQQLHFFLRPLKSCKKC